MSDKFKKNGKSYFNYFIIILTLFILFDIFYHNFNLIYAADNNRPVAVMVGNSVDERKYQKGINNADIVYEIEVEFPFTRYMALFLSNTNTKIGPVRSSRYYFSRLCSEWGAIFAHCGGQNLKNDKILDVDQMKYSRPYWRDSRIGGWINLFTSIDKLRGENQKKEKETKKEPLKHNLLNYTKLNESEQKSNLIKKIVIKYHQDYVVSYDYNENDHKYYQYINKKPHIDRETGETIRVSNIIIQFVNVEKIANDKLGRIDVELVGKGVAKIFANGNYDIAKWEKSSKNKKTVFLDKNENEIAYNQGNHWVHILSSKAEVWIK